MTIVKLLNTALANVPKAYDLIFISGGICDFTEKCKQTKKISLRRNATTTLVDDLEAMVRENLAVGLLRCHNPNVIMTTTYGVSLSDYILNYNGPVPHPQQKDLNDCVRRLNVMLAVLELTFGVAPKYVLLTFTMLNSFTPLNFRFYDCCFPNLIYIT